MNVSVDHDSRAKRRICTLQFVIAGIGHGSSPQIARAGMRQAKTFSRVLTRKSFQPSQAFFPNARQRRRNHLLDSGKKGRNLRRLGGKFRQALRRPQHLVRIPADPRPRERADLIDNLRWVCSPYAKSPPCTTTSGATCRKSVTTASNARRFPCTSDTIATLIFSPPHRASLRTPTCTQRFSTALRRLSRSFRTLSALSASTPTSDFLVQILRRNSFEEFGEDIFLARNRFD